jgi:hypothetical protein
MAFFAEACIKVYLSVRKHWYCYHRADMPLGFLVITNLGMKRGRSGPDGLKHSHIVTEYIINQSIRLDRKHWQLRRSIRESERRGYTYTSWIRIASTLNVRTCVDKVAAVCRIVNSGPS